MALQAAAQSHEAASTSSSSPPACMASFPFKPIGYVKSCFSQRCVIGYVATSGKQAEQVRRSVPDTDIRFPAETGLRGSRFWFLSPVARWNSSRTSPPLAWRALRGTAIVGSSTFFTRTQARNCALFRRDDAARDAALTRLRSTNALPCCSPQTWSRYLVGIEHPSTQRSTCLG